MELAGMLIAIESPENPVYAIARPPTVVSTPPTMASPPIHLGYVRPASNATPYTVTVRPNTETQHAGESDLDLPDGKRALKGDLFLRRWRTGPGIHHGFQRHAVHGLERRSDGQAGDGSSRPETGPRAAAPRLQLFRQDQERRHHQRNSCQLGQVARDPQLVGGVFGECGHTVVRIGIHRVKIGPHEKEHAATNGAGRSDSVFAAVRHLKPSRHRLRRGRAATLRRQPGRLIELHQAVSTKITWIGVLSHSVVGGSPRNGMPLIAA